MAGWLVAQPVFFVSTAPLAADGSVNCSPKGNRDEFAVLGSAGSRSSTKPERHRDDCPPARKNGRIVVMFCAFAGPPRIVRLHGVGRVVLTDSPDFSELSRAFCGRALGVPSAIVIEVLSNFHDVAIGVPLMSFEGHRPTMDQWSDRKGPEGIREYWAEKNVSSIDRLEGLTPTSQ